VFAALFGGSSAANCLGSLKPRADSSKKAAINNTVLSEKPGTRYRIKTSSGFGQEISCKILWPLIAGSSL
jgi:hypothetical protein